MRNRIDVLCVSMPLHDETWSPDIHGSTSRHRPRVTVVEGVVGGLGHPAVTVAVVDTQQGQSMVEQVRVGGHGGNAVTRPGLLRGIIGHHRRVMTSGPPPRHRVTGHWPAVAWRALTCLLYTSPSPRD